MLFLKNIMYRRCLIGTGTNITVDSIRNRLNCVSKIRIGTIGARMGSCPERVIRWTRIGAGGISPTAINNYLRCQLRFFYRYVCGINEPDSTEDDLIDNRLFGNIFHKAAQIIYGRFGNNTISKEMLDGLLKEEVSLERAVDEAFKQEFFKITDPSRPLPPLDGLQLINREVIIKYIRQLVEVDRRFTPFRILGLEKCK